MTSTVLIIPCTAKSAVCPSARTNCAHSEWKHEHIVYSAISQRNPSNCGKSPSSGKMATSSTAPARIVYTPTEKMLRRCSVWSTAKRNTPSVMPRLMSGKSRLAVCVMRSAVP